MDDRAKKSLEFMRDPMQWPYLALPVKRYVDRGGAGGVEVGVMFDERPRVYTVNMYELKEYNGKPVDEIPHKDYIDLEGVVDDGWVVD